MGIIKKTREFYLSVIAKITEAFSRAKASNLRHLPEKVGEANCGNCHYYRTTDSPEVGYCDHSEVSLFVTERQLCNQWAQNGVVKTWDKEEPVYEPDHRDFPPEVDETVEKNPSGGIKYKDKMSILRAESEGLKTLPGDVAGANCANCVFSTYPGWCKNENINQPIEKTDLCNNWTHPGAVLVKNK